MMRAFLLPDFFFFVPLVKSWKLNIDTDCKLITKTIEYFCFLFFSSDEEVYILQRRYRMKLVLFCQNGYVQIGITKYVYGGACDLNWAKIVAFRLIYLRRFFSILEIKISTKTEYTKYTSVEIYLCIYLNLSWTKCGVMVTEIEFHSVAYNLINKRQPTIFSCSFQLLSRNILFNRDNQSMIKKKKKKKNFIRFFNNFSVLKVYSFVL